ncbi:hypothetical protein TIFTF001_025554 [Ficus carica]|uniref:Uncharacterized protein n=1 Tax=Ficus carica TaxID=3494 RepID=A0AA88DE99_FICCA|nr:hypothetical protein TIFTF001_025554 [Ficus carica]
MKPNFIQDLQNSHRRRRTRRRSSRRNVLGDNEITSLENGDLCEGARFYHDLVVCRRDYRVVSPSRFSDGLVVKIAKFFGPLRRGFAKSISDFVCLAIAKSSLTTTAMARRISVNCACFPLSTTFAGAGAGAGAGYDLKNLTGWRTMKLG